MRDFVIKLKRWDIALVCVALWVSGCATNEKIKVAADGAPEYHNLQISYDLASSPELQRLDQPPRIEQTAAVESTSSSAATSRPWTRRRVHLDLQYPYPGVHPAFARATLRIVSDDKRIKPGEQPKKTDAAEPAPLPVDDDVAVGEEVLYIDLPKTELDEVLRDLAKTDFFRLPSNPDGASHVLVVYNKGRCEKGWAREEHLDKLVDLLRKHGAPLRMPDAKKS